MSDHAVLSSERHRDLRVRTDHAPALGDAVMACIAVPSEFRQVQAHYPILFRQDVERTGFTALALFGWEQGENLFLVSDNWDAPYIPLAQAIQPFLIGRGGESSADKQVHIDLASPRVGSGEGVRLFDEFGRPTPYLEDIAGKLGTLDAGWQASEAFFAALRRHELLEPFALDVTLDDGSKNRLVGYHIIDEERLRGLDASALGDLHAEGHLLPIFMAVASLGRINDLIARRNRKLAGG